MSRKASNDKLFSMRTLIGFVLITICTIVLVFICLFVVSARCINNFYDEMPVYPDAELIEQHSSPLNWIGAGDLEFVYRTQDSISTVESWYRVNVDNLIVQSMRASATGEEAPETWWHDYRITSTSEGTEIRLEADCLN